MNQSLARARGRAWRGMPSERSRRGPQPRPLASPVRRPAAAGAGAETARRWPPSVNCRRLGPGAGGGPRAPSVDRDSACRHAQSWHRPCLIVDPVKGRPGPLWARARRARRARGGRGNATRPCPHRRHRPRRRSGKARWAGDGPACPVVGPSYTRIFLLRVRKARVSKFEWRNWDKGCRIQDNRRCGRLARLPCQDLSHERSTDPWTRPFPPIPPS